MLTSAEPFAALPNIPSAKAVGVTNMDIISWWSVHVPAGTPMPVVEKLTGWFNQIATSDDAKKILVRSRLRPLIGNAALVDEMIAKETKEWADVREDREDRAAVSTVGAFVRKQRRPLPCPRRSAQRHDCCQFLAARRRVPLSLPYCIAHIRGNEESKTAEKAEGPGQTHARQGVARASAGECLRSTKNC